MAMVQKNIFRTVIKPSVRKGIALAILVHVSIVLYLNAANFPNVDEVAHLTAGIALLSYGDIAYYRVNPPLVRSIAAIPAVMRGDAQFYPWLASEPDSYERNEFNVGYEHLRLQGIKSHHRFFWPRVFCLPLSICGLVATFYLGKELVDNTAGLAAAFIWATDPNICSNAATINPDLGATAFGVLVSLSILRFRRHDSRSNALYIAAFSGLSVLTKFSWLSLALSVPLAMILRGKRENRKFFGKAFYTHRFRMIAIWMIATLLIFNAGYAFRGVGKSLSEIPLANKSEKTNGPNQSVRSWLNGLVLQVPLPVPDEAIRGLSYLDYERGLENTSFLAGESKKGTWPHYYAFALFLKTPAATFVLAVAGLVWLSWTRREWIIVFLPQIVLFFALSAAGGFNHHFRYVLPAYIVIIVGAAICFSRLQKCGNMLRRLGATTIFAAVATGCYSMPFPHSHFTMFVGGSSVGYKWLDFSNIEWGQDLSRLRQYVDTLPSNSTLFTDLAFRSTDPILMCRSCLPLEDIESYRVTTQEQNLPRFAYVIVHSKRLKSIPFKAAHERIGLGDPVKEIGDSYKVYRFTVR